MTNDPMLLAATLALGACNTAKGLGGEVNSAGKAVSKSADDVKKQL